MKRALFASAAVVTLLVAGIAKADSVTVDMNAISAKGVGGSIGTVMIEDAPNGGVYLHLRIKPEALTPGPHGFHVHQNGSCDAADKDGKMVAGLAAGGHYDPDGAGKHMGPAGGGHKGDLPVIFSHVDDDGAVEIYETKYDARLSVAELKGKSLMIHAGGDNYSDEPAALGGGGARVACGVIPG